MGLLNIDSIGGKRLHKRVISRRGAKAQSRNVRLNRWITQRRKDAKEAQRMNKIVRFSVSEGRTLSDVRYLSLSYG